MSHKLYCSKCPGKTEVYPLTDTGTHIIYRCKGPGRHTTWIDKESPAVRVQSARQVQPRYGAA